MLTEFSLDPPASSQDIAGDPHLDEDYLILSTIHSAKGLEWKVVYAIHAVDGNLPSDMATGCAEQTTFQAPVVIELVNTSQQVIPIGG